MDDEFDFRYLRVKRISDGTFLDELCAYARACFPGEDIPAIWWRYTTPEAFVERFGGPIRWAVPMSYHMLYWHGIRVFRIWTQTYNRDTTVVDLADPLAVRLETVLDVIDIPKGSLDKAKPFKRRVRIDDGEQLAQVCAAAKEIYGIHHS